ncbi:hypothetical protein E0Z10_g7853 [Xylaria hypoxylon]|uniref:HNH nuclease domain-containing protein n=1 Tax=Xylaria hypoxylon TaxID=37992 RepID=A0A4Z0YWV4_9PEZI|nr:hypothetical protein E0Z10_g7853 [Xylaria hypoxylon]
MRLQPQLPPPIPPNQDNDQENRFIEFYHPAYPPSTPPLLQLIAVDQGDGQLGIDYDFAKAACGVIADNRWDDAAYIAIKNRPAQLSAEPSAFTKVTRPEDGVLPIPPPGSTCWYYFVVDNPTHCYPVVPSFDHWRFPHNIPLPRPWNTLHVPIGSGQVSGSETGKFAARMRDGSCRVTGFIETCEAAHLIPYAEHEWFQSNDMRRYCRLPTLPPVDDEANLLTLRADIHTLFDQHRFAFVPKTEDARIVHNPHIADDTQPLSAPLVVHALLPRNNLEISQYYHNRPLQSLVGIKVQFLFARFALSILGDELYIFFNSGPQKYTVRLYDKEKGEQYTDQLDGVTIRDRSQIFYSSSSRTRSVSPEKRKAPSAHQEDDFTERGRARYRSPDYYKHQRELQRSGPDCERSNSTPASLSFTSTVSSSHSPPETHIQDKVNESVTAVGHGNGNEANNEEIDLTVVHMLKQKQHFDADAPSTKRQRVQ